MIKINGKELSVKRFSAGEVGLTYTVKRGERYDVAWWYENDGELFQLIALTEHIKERGGLVHTLRMPYCPNARMDRVKDPQSEVFTLKYFIGIINGLGYKRVYIDNPHSDVCMTINGAISDNKYIDDIDDVMLRVGMDARLGGLSRKQASLQGATGGLLLASGDDDVNGFTAERDVVFYPDASAVKRYASKVPFPYLWGDKERNWDNRNIQRYAIIGEVPKRPFNVLFIDDICGYGSSIYYASKALRELGAASIYVYVTHLENGVWEGRHPDGATDGKNLFNCGLGIKKIYTTDSIYSGPVGEASNDKIEIILRGSFN